MAHLLIDRFRFDSFAPDSDEAGSNLLTRFGHSVYLFFVITPPELLVERAWKRGLEFGRYKAVDDTLAHSVEAYTGMPDVFFTWVRRTDKRIHFEFLDNTVRLGELPRTAAFGDNYTLNVSGCQQVAGYRALRPRQCQRIRSGELVSRSRLARSRAQRRIPEALDSGVSRSQFRGARLPAGSTFASSSGGPVLVDREALHKAQ